MKTYLPLAAAAIIAVPATIHLVYTLQDMFGRPRYFTPRDRALLEAMQTAITRTAQFIPSGGCGNSAALFSRFLTLSFPDASRTIRTGSRDARPN